MIRSPTITVILSATTFFGPCAKTAQEKSKQQAEMIFFRDSMTSKVLFIKKIKPVQKVFNKNLSVKTQKKCLAPYFLIMFSLLLLLRKLLQRRQLLYHYNF